MPDINPAQLSHNDNFAQPLLPSSLSSRTNGSNAPAIQKTSKPNSAVQRVDLEPLYTSLKIAIGDHWTEYKDGVSLYILGQLNQQELSIRLDHFVNTNPLTENVHNQLLAGIFSNIARELPEAGVAPWVSANDKPSVVSKPISGDAVEQRLKAEVMQLPARDRRRLKEAPEAERIDTPLHDLSLYHAAKQFRVPDAVPTTAGGAHKTNWDLEIRKRYSQPLAAETGEFPDADAINGRMIPICYEESLANGAGPQCADFMATATEHYIKEVLSAIYNRTRSNLPAGSGNGISTHRFKRQCIREEQDLLNGSLFRGPGSDLLPVEIKEAQSRPPLSMRDLRVGLEVGDIGLGQLPTVISKIMGGSFDTYEEEELEDVVESREDGRKRVGGLRMANGTAAANGAHAPAHDVASDDQNWGWDGGAAADREALHGILDDCLAIGQ